MKNIDAIIIGSGQAGNPLALKLASAGWKTVLIERSEDHLGGTCTNEGCTPTKTLIGSAEKLHHIKTANEYGLSIRELNIDFRKIQKRKNDIVIDSRKKLNKRLAKTKNLELIFGTASFLNNKTVSIDTVDKKEILLNSKSIFINVGCRPTKPEIKGLDRVPYYDSTSILSIKTIPKQLIIIGGSSIGLELGQMFSRFGTKVTIIEQSPQILPHEDKDVANSLLKILESEDLEFKLNVTINKVSLNNKDITVEIKEKTKIASIKGSHLLVATGRTPNTDLLKVNTSGIIMNEKGFIKVNNKLETNVKGIYALGDVNGGPAFTHIAYDDYRIVYKNLVKNQKLSTKNRIIPYCIFTDPQLGRVGLNEDQAKKQNLDIEVITILGSRITRGLEIGSTEGLWKALVDKKTGLILGASIIGSQGGEIVSVIQMAMLGKIKAKEVRDGIFAHPTFSESLNTLFMELNS